MSLSGEGHQEAAKGEKRRPDSEHQVALTSKPKKRLYRARAHSNPLNDHSFDVPLTPKHVNWSAHYPAWFQQQQQQQQQEQPGDQQHDSSHQDQDKVAKEVEHLDVGCGFGGFLIKLAELYPDKLSLGLELRDKVTEYVAARIETLRENAAKAGGGESTTDYGNVAVLRANAQKDLPHYFRNAQLTKVFFLFPDPHFKACNHRRRIISQQLLDEYAHFIRPGGLVYTITDVEELGKWMQGHLDRHPMFLRVSDEELERDGDEAFAFLPTASEEAQKVKRNEGRTYRAVFRRV